MNKVLTILSLLTLIFTGLPVNAQPAKDQALAKAKEAIRLEDEEEKYDEAIKLLEEARKLDPDNFTYPYELAYTYSAKKDYKKASDILETLANHKGVNARYYQALGNAYDHQGRSELAVATYEKGLKKYPTSGGLLLELGNIQLIKKDLEKALSYYEKGIMLDPSFSSNYYWAARIFCNTNEEVWGLIYGEIFMNLERNTKRTAEISKLLFDTYKGAIKFTNDTAFSVSFSQNATMRSSDIKDGKIKLPFGTGVYEMQMIMAMAGMKEIDMNALDIIRRRFVEGYFSGETARKYPNVLFDYQRKVMAAGHMEAYNHWILMKGDEPAFEGWLSGNKEKWEAFAKWFPTAPLVLDDHYKFYRAQY